MKGFALDSNGDVKIKNGEIQMVIGTELTRQTVQSVLGTNKGEWFINWDEGINFDNILGKKKYHKANTVEIDNAELEETKRDMSELSERLEKRLDGEL